MQNFLVKLVQIFGPETTIMAIFFSIISFHVTLLIGKPEHIFPLRIFDLKSLIWKHYGVFNIF